VKGKNELDLELRKYKLDDLLFVLAKRSQNMYMEGEALQNTCFSRKVGNMVLSSKSIILPIWGLAELSWRAIKNSNDHRYYVVKEADIVKLNNLLAKVTNEESREKQDNRSSEDVRFYIFHGISQTQLWWQDLVKGRKRFLYNFLRYYLLLNEMPKYLAIGRKPDEDLIEITGFNIEDFSKLLFAGYAWSATIGPEFDFDKHPIDKELTNRNPVITRNNLLKCISFFTEDYSYYRLGGHPHNPILFKPIIRTQTNRLIIANVFTWAKKLYEGIYWLIRDKYCFENSRFFTSAFGEYYEKYIEELLKYYLRPDTFKKITEEGRADWAIYTDKYIIIVEQKSSLMSIELKTAYPSVNKLDSYMDIFRKACSQLSNTSGDIKDGRRAIINLVLHFEKIYFREVDFKNRVSKKCGFPLRKYYFIDTEEFEMLMQILSADQKKFNKIIEEKMAYEDKPPSPAEGLDFNTVIDKMCGWEENKFLEKYQYIFETIASGK